MSIRLLFPLWLRFRARGFEKVPLYGPAILVINHQSFLDGMIVGLPLSRPIRYLARDSLFHVPFLGWLLRNSYAIPINREKGGSSIRTAVEQLKQGFLVGIFPEGTRSGNNEIGHIKPGFIALIRRAGVPVIPVGIAGAGAALPRNTWFPRHKTCRVVCGDPIPPETLEELSRRGSEQALLDEIRARMTQCQNEAQEWLTQ